MDETGRREDAEPWIRRAAEAGNADAMTLLAALLLECDRREEAEQLLRRAAEAGNPGAMVTLGDLSEFKEQAGWRAPPCIARAGLAATVVAPDPVPGGHHPAQLGQVWRLGTCALTERRELLKIKIVALFEANDEEYGYRRMRQALIRGGEQCCPELVRHLSFIVSPPRGSPRPSRQAPGNMQSVLMRPSSSRMRTSRPPLTASPLSVDTVSQVNLTTLRRRTASSRGRKVYCPGAMNRS